MELVKYLAKHGIPERDYKYWEKINELDAKTRLLFFRTLFLLDENEIKYFNVLLKTKSDINDTKNFDKMHELIKQEKEYILN